MIWALSLPDANAIRVPSERLTDAVTFEMPLATLERELSVRGHSTVGSSSPIALAVPKRQGQPGISEEVLGLKSLPERMVQADARVILNR